MQQTREELNKFYQQPDPWNYQTTQDDMMRMQKIIEVARKHGPFQRAIDIGCGEGFITQHLPAFERYGYDLSDIAMSRLPDAVIPFPMYEVEKRRNFKKFDLVLATGVFYPQYDYQAMIELCKFFSNYMVITCNIEGEQWEQPEVMDIGKQIEAVKFPYRGYTEVLRVFKI